jgi:hypothetical protein
VHDVEVIMARLRDARALPELLAASLDAFEAIRVVARGSEDLAPWLFAAFMTAADAAVDGTQAITIAPSLSLAPTGALIVAAHAAGAAAANCGSATTVPHPTARPAGAYLLCSSLRVTACWP